MFVGFWHFCSFSFFFWGGSVSVCVFSQGFLVIFLKLSIQCAFFATGQDRPVRGAVSSCNG